MMKRRYPYMPHRRRFEAITPPNGSTAMRRQFERMCRENEASRQILADIRTIVSDINLRQAQSTTHFMAVLTIRRILRGMQP